MEIKSIEQIKDEVAQADNFHNWQILFESCAMYDYGRLEKAINEVAERYAQQFQTPTDVLTTEIMVLRERNEELVEMLVKAKSTIAVLKRSMLVHPDCELGSEFCDRTTDAQNLEDEIEELFNKVTNGN